MLGRTRFRRLVILAAAYVLAPSVTIGQSVSGGLDQLTDAVIEAAFAHERAQPFDFIFDERGTRLQLQIVALFSEQHEVSLFANRCAANSLRRRIGCDLRFLNSIVSGMLALSDPIEPGNASDRAKSEFSNGPYRAMLKWVLAHEIGHIVLNHTEGNYSDSIHGHSVFDSLEQKKENEADAFSVNLMGKLDSTTNIQDYAFALDVTNTLIRLNLCPETFPATCSRIAPGVGVLYNHADDKPILIPGGGKHPDFVARFLRLIYLSGVGTKENSINYLAMRAIEKLMIENPHGQPRALIELLPE